MTKIPPEEHSKIHRLHWPELLGSLSNHDDDCNKNPTNLLIWQLKTVLLHALHVHFSSFDILKTFSFFLWREMTCFAVVWTTWAYDDKCSILSSYVPSAGSRMVRMHFSSIMTLNNWKIIAETRRYIFRWRSRFSRRRVCLSSLLTDNDGAFQLREFNLWWKIPSEITNTISCNVIRHRLIFPSKNATLMTVRKRTAFFIISFVVEITCTHYLTTQKSIIISR